MRPNHQSRKPFRQRGSESYASRSIAAERILLRREASFKVAAPQSIVVASVEPLSGLGVLSIHAERPPPFRRQRTSPSPEGDLVWPRTRSFPGASPRGEHHRSPRDLAVIETNQDPSPLSSSPPWLGTTPATRTSVPLPCSTLARPGLKAPAETKPAPTCGTLPLSGVVAPADTPGSRLTRPATGELPRLVIAVAQTLTSLEGVTLRVTHRMSQPPGRA